MATLCELRKIGGFSDLEGRPSTRAIGSAQSIAGGSSGSANIIGMKNDRVSRGHPSLLLDIIETMFLAKNDPSSAILQKRLMDHKSLCEMVTSCVPMHDITKEFDFAMVSATHSIALVAQMITGLNFILARHGKLRAARAYIEPEPDIAGAHSTRNAKNVRVPQSIIGLIESCCARMSELHAKTDLLLASASLLNADNIIARNYEEHEKFSSRISREAQELCDDKLASLIKDGIDCGTLDESSLCDQRTTVAPSEARTADKYIAQSILAARIVQNIEEYISNLNDDIKKIKMALDIVTAQCAVSMSNLAVIA